MITIDLGIIEYYDDESSRFIYEEGGKVRFEYTLKALYDWEGKWKKPFLKGEITDDEIKDFYKRMALDPLDERFLTQEVCMTLKDYIEDNPTATTFSSMADGQNGNNGPRRAKIQTAEEIYAMMFMSQIPMEWEERNLNRLLTIIRIMSNYNSPPKKMSKEDILKQNQELNRQRRAQYKTKG